MKHKFTFWLKECYLRVKHLSLMFNQTRYNHDVDRILNECLDNPTIKHISNFIVTFVHPSGKIYTFWIANWSYAFGDMYLSTCDYKGLGVYYTTRYRLNNFIDNCIGEELRDDSDQYTI